jgi:hypothetical protein
MEFDFSKNMSVVTLDPVPEAYRGVYVEQDDGTFAVNDSVKGIVQAYVGQTEALNTARNDLTKANNESAGRRVELSGYSEMLGELGVQVPEGETPVEVLKSFINDLTSKVQGGQELQVNLEKIREEANKRILEAETKGNEKIQFMQSALQQHMVGEVATAALAKMEGSVDLLMPHVVSHCKVIQDGENFVVRVVDSAGDARSNGAGGWMTVSDLVTEMKTQEKFAPAFKSEEKSGSGIVPGSTSKPVTRQQAEMSSTDKIADGLAKKQHVSS